MALTYDQISAITANRFIPKLVDNIFQANYTLKYLKDKCEEKVNGGNMILQPLNYATNAASGWFSGLDTLDITDNQEITAASYNWKQIYSNITISRLDEVKNSGDSAILSFVKAKTQIAEKTLGDNLGVGIYNAGLDPKAIIGMQYLATNLNSPGGISSVNYSWWQVQTDSVTTVLSMAALMTMYNAATIGNDKPDLITCGRTLYNSYYALLQPQQRFMDSKVAHAGFESLMFNGTPIVVDAHCPTNFLCMLNSKYIILAVHPDENFRFEPFVKPTNQSAKIGKIYWTGALCFSNLRMLGFFTALAS